MDEQTIADRLKQKIASPPEADESVVVTQPDTDPPNQANVAIPAELDEITQYKLHDFFGEPYKEYNEINRQRLNYIYEQISDMVNSTDYGLVVAKMRELEQIIGIAQSPDRMYKFYHWLRLNNIRKDIDLQMGVLSNGS